MLSVIMAGGFGQRFWPRSTRERPKQLIDLTGKGSMISLTVKRVRSLSQPEEILIVTNAAQADAIAEDVGAEIPRENIVGEPVGRNTAPSIGLAAVLVRRRFGDAPFIVLPADHLIADQGIFENAARVAESFVSKNDCLLTFGIKPSRPETGYGYIHAGQPIADVDKVELFRAIRFHEKPTHDKAEAFLNDGSYFWNSGMFCWRPRVILEAIEKHIPELDVMLREFDDRLGTEDLDNVLNSIYSKAPSISIDYGVMEKADNVVVLRGDFYWNDVGSWESIRDVFPADSKGNVLVGDHVVLDSSKNTVFSPDRTVGLIGVEDVVIVDGGNAILVCKRDRVQQVREIVETLTKNGKEQLT
ncbi:MAG: mannose-1-phosphate guanylyltransferase [Candidatus Latescibacterota bacterium]|nr:MAG: mannose-1-phosphate guanylyltransferase [Candidatus Latescibacterota bacterium]